MKIVTITTSSDITYRASIDETKAVSIDRQQNGEWIWAGDGRWDNGTIADCTADLGDEAYGLLDDALVEVYEPLTYADVVKLQIESLNATTLVVSDGTYRWLADREKYDAAMASEVSRIRTGDEAEADYYSDFCNLCRSLDRTDPARAVAAKALYREIHGSEPNWA